MADDIETILTQLTLEEKASLLAGADLWHTVPIKRLGIPALKMTDGPVGARGAGGSSGPRSACFPCGSALAATWDEDLVRHVGEALAEETQAKGAQLLLGPTVNIHRSPLAGRNFECYSEDPILAARMAIAYITGLQQHGVGACIKHFVCNDSEFERQSLSSEVGERALREIYLLPFELAVREAHPWALMSAYNRLNGIYCSEHPRLLDEILKREWGFDGAVISDWLGTYGPGVPAGGLDLEMPGPGRWQSAQQILKQVKSGLLGLARLEDKARRILRLIERAGLLNREQRVLETEPEQAIDLPEHRLLARRAAAQSIVLLKNTGAMLPLDRGKCRSLAVIGYNGHYAQPLGGGSAEVTPHYVISPLAGIQQAVGPEVQVYYSPGVMLNRQTSSFEISWLVPVEGQHGFEVEFFDNLELAGAPVNQWFCDRASIEWANHLLRGLSPQRFSASLSANFIPPVSGRYRFSLLGNGRCRLFVEEKILVDRWQYVDMPDRLPDGGVETPGEVELQAGSSYHLKIEYAFEGNNPWRRLQIGCQPPVAADLLEQAVSLAGRCDAAIVVAGLTPEWESEGFDRVDMDLPAEQNELIARVAAANPSTVVVLNAGSPVRMPWLAQVSAILQYWYPGQEGGNALADVLFGDVNPSGRLPTTFPVRLEDNPAYINYPGENGKVLYGEGLFVGYRYYDHKDIQPLFPFGYGLSYTTFSISNLRLDKEYYQVGETLRFRVDVTNTGERPGTETVQVYLHDRASSLVRPLRELKAFRKAFLGPGETCTLEFSLDERALAFYDDRRQAWIIEPGEFELQVGSSSRHIHCTAGFTWLGSGQAGETDGSLMIGASQAGKTSRLHPGLPIRALLADPAGKAVLRQHFGDLIDHPMLEMALDLSLEQVAGFVPDLITAERLEKVRANLAEAG